jgi:CheY-like chemotaxis protein
MKRVLVVEDNKLERTLMVRLLNSFLRDKVIIDDVGEGSKALFYLSSLNYNLVITDLIMPHVEGLELINTIRRNYSECKIIAVTGSKPFYLHLAKKMGVQEVFTKPIDHTKFIDVVSAMLK